MLSRPYPNELDGLIERLEGAVTSGVSDSIGLAHLRTTVESVERDLRDIGIPELDPTRGSNRQAFPFGPGAGSRAAACLPLLSRLKLAVTSGQPITALDFAKHISSRLKTTDL